MGVPLFVVENLLLGRSIVDVLVVVVEAICLGVRHRCWGRSHWGGQLQCRVIIVVVVVIFRWAR